MGDLEAGNFLAIAERFSQAYEVGLQCLQKNVAVGTISLPCFGFLIGPTLSDVRCYGGTCSLYPVPAKSLFVAFDMPRCSSGGIFHRRRSSEVHMQGYTQLHSFTGSFHAIPLLS